MPDIPASITPSKPLRLAVDALPAMPGKSGAVGLFRSMLQLAPGIDETLEMVYIVSPSQKAYYEKFMPEGLGKRVRFHLLNYPESQRFFRIAAQDLAVPWICGSEKLNVHFSLNPEPLFGMRGVAEVFKVADLQYLEVPEEFGAAKTTYRRLMGRRKARRSALLIANSEYTRRKMVEYFDIPPERIEVVYEALDHSLFRPDCCDQIQQATLLQKHGLPEQFIIYVASFRPYKNHLPLLRAFETLIQKHHLPHHLVLVGNDIGDYRRVVEEAAHNMEPASRDRVHFLDYVHHWDLPCLYQAASLAVYPSGLETFGIPPLEAMACGTPVIASDATAVPEVSGGGASIINPHDTSGFSEAMFAILEDPACHTELAARGLAWAQRYTWRNNVTQTLDLMRNLVKLR